VATTGHGDVPPGRCPAAPASNVGRLGTIKEILVGRPTRTTAASTSWRLRTSMATCGYESVKEFQKAEVMVAPALQTEGKTLQREQRVGMGH